MKIIDTSSNTTSQVDCIASEGVQTIFRYYASTVNWKVITLSEAEAISNAGMQIGVVFEDGNNLDSFTEATGYDNATSAYTYATQTINQPYGSAIYFAVDLDVTDAQIQSDIIPYFRGIQEGFKESGIDQQSYKVGAYGCGSVINELLNEGLCEFRWLSESSSYNGTNEALTNGNYELVQQYKADLEICTIAVDQDNLREGVTDIGAFTLKDD
jgi:hypothetical protein